MRRDVAALAAADRVEPVAVVQPGVAVLAPSVARHAQRRVVLLRATDVIRHVAGRRHVVQLGRRVDLPRPGLAAVDRHVATAVVAVGHACRMSRVDPQVVVVAVGHGNRRVRLATVGALVEARVEYIDRVTGHRIGVDARVVEGSLAQAAVVADTSPALAAVVRLEHPALVVLDDGVDARAIGARHRHPDLADDAAWQSRLARQLGPGLAAVARLEEPAAGAAARHLPRDPVRLPHRGVEHGRVGAVDHQVNRAGLVVAEERLLPGLSTVGRLEDPARGVWRGGMPEHRRIDEVGIGGMHADAADDLRVSESGMGPGLARVSRLVDAVALHDVAPQRHLAHPDVDHVRLRFRHRDGPDRRTPDLAVGHGLPRRAAVSGLPQAAPDRAEVVLQRAGRAAGDGQRAPAAVGSHVAPLERVEESGGHARRGRGRRLPRQRDRRESRPEQGERSHG